MNAFHGGRKTQVPRAGDMVVTLVIAGALACAAVVLTCVFDAL